MLLKEGTVLKGRYVIQSILNDAGPIDVKYLARDEQSDTEVVIREYFPVAVTDRMEDGITCKARDGDTFAYGLAEYKLEGSTLARLQHPHVVPCLGVFEENGTIYRVSEHRMGISLRAFLRQKGGKISVNEAEQIVMQIMDGLEAGHELGLIHGGLSNISVFFDRGKTPVLCNFQAARIFVAQLTGNIKEVRDKGFAAPEIKSKRDNLGPWSDVYSVGCLLYYMVTGNILPTVIYTTHIERVKTELDKLKGDAARLKHFFENTLVFEYKKRPPTINALRGMLIGATVTEPEPADAVFDLPESESLEQESESVKQIDDEAGEPGEVLSEMAATTGVGSVASATLNGTSKKSATGSTQSSESLVSDTEDNTSQRTSKKENKPGAAPASRSNIKLEEKEEELQEEMLKEANDMEHGERLSATPVPAHREDHLPVRRNPQDDELRARLAKLESRQQGMNRFFAVSAAVALLVCLMLYLNPGILKSIGLTTATGKTATGRTDASRASRETPAAAQVQPSPGAARANDNGGAMAAEAGSVAAAAVVVDSLAAEETLKVDVAETVESEVASFVEPAPAAAAPLTPAPTPAEPGVEDQLAAQRAAREQAARVAAQIEAERQYQYERGRGDVLFDQAKWQEAIDAFQAGLKVRPGDRYLANRMAAARDSMANMKPESGLTLEEEREFQYLLGQGDVLFDDREWERAIVIYKEAINLKPDNEDMLARIAVAEDSLAAETAVRAEEKALRDMIARVTDEEGIFIVPTVPAAMIEEAQVRNGVRYPARAKRAGVEGRVIVRMIVNEQGKVERPTVTEGIGFGCDEEVTRVLTEATFQPASFNGKPVKSWYMFSVVFSMK